MIYVKDGVHFEALRREVLNMLPYVDAIYSGLGYNVVITSANDGVHNPGSLHYANLALDFRIKHLPKTLWIKVAEMLAHALGAGYDVLLESPETENAHIHLEWDPERELR